MIFHCYQEGGQGRANVETRGYLRKECPENHLHPCLQMLGQTILYAALKVGRPTPPRFHLSSLYHPQRQKFVFRKR